MGGDTRSRLDDLQGGDRAGRTDRGDRADQQGGDAPARRAASEGYRDDPDDIFVPRRERPKMDLNQRVQPDESDESDHADRSDQQTGDRTARDWVRGFDPRRAGGRADIDEAEAVRYLAEQGRTQPKFRGLTEQDPSVQRVYAGLDRGWFHGTTRHEGGLTSEDHLRRLLLREDPAQADEAKRARAVDAYRKGNQRHLCPEYSTSVEDPVAYAVALARGVEHPRVREVLDAAPDETWDEERTRTQIRISELLGDDGHEYCKGYQLVGEDLRQATKERDAYLKSQWKGQQNDLPEPRAERISSFEDGVLEFRFRATDGNSRYRLITMFPKPFADPPDDDETGR